MLRNAVPAKALSRELLPVGAVSTPQQTLLVLYSAQVPGVVLLLEQQIPGTAGAYHLPSPLGFGERPHPFPP